MFKRTTTAVVVVVWLMCSLGYGSVAIVHVDLNTTAVGVASGLRSNSQQSNRGPEAEAHIFVLNEGPTGPSTAIANAIAVTTNYGPASASGTGVSDAQDTASANSVASSESLAASDVYFEVQDVPTMVYINAVLSSTDASGLRPFFSLSRGQTTIWAEYLQGGNIAIPSSGSFLLSPGFYNFYIQANVSIGAFGPDSGGTITDVFAVSQYEYSLSSTPAPEPSTMAAMLMMGCFAAGRRLKREKSKGSSVALSQSSPSSALVR